MGVANANVAKMVIDDINAGGGLLGRRVDLYLEDSETTESVGEAKAAKLVEQEDVDVILGGIYSSMRQAIKGPAVEQGKKLYIYPEQYEGQECDPLIFCTGPVPAQQVEPLIPWLMEDTGAKKFYLPSSDYIWPHIMNKKVHEAASSRSSRSSESSSQRNAFRESPEFTGGRPTRIERPLQEWPGSRGSSARESSGPACDASRLRPRGRSPAWRGTHARLVRCCLFW